MLGRSVIVRSASSRVSSSLKLTATGREGRAYGTMSGRQLFAERAAAPLFLRPIVIDVRDMKASAASSPSSSSAHAAAASPPLRRPLSTLQLETEQQLLHGLHYHHVPFVVGAPARHQLHQFQRVLQLLQLPLASSAAINSTLTAAHLASAVAVASSSSTPSLPLSSSSRAVSPKLVIIAHQADQAAAVADLLEKSGYTNVFALNGGGFLDLVDAVNEDCEYAAKRF